MWCRHKCGRGVFPRYTSPSGGAIPTAVVVRQLATAGSTPPMMCCKLFAAVAPTTVRGMMRLRIAMLLGHNFHALFLPRRVALVLLHRLRPRVLVPFSGPVLCRGMAVPRAAARSSICSHYRSCTVLKNTANQNLS